MAEDIKLTKLASCAGCGAKVGAGVLVKLLDDLKVIKDERLIVGFDKSDDASVYVINDETAIVQTVDFFPPIVDDPFLFGQIAAANAISDVYAMGGEPRLALNIMTVSNKMSGDNVHDVLRGGYEKAYEAGVIITGGHTIEDVEPKYGLAVTGFVHPQKVLKNAGAREGDVLILTKPLGIGIITTAAKAGLAGDALLEKIYRQMATLNKYARDIMIKYDVHACTDVTGFSLMGHGLEMAQGSGLTMHIKANDVKYHSDALEFAEMGFIPAGAYRNRDYAEKHVRIADASETNGPKAGNTCVSRALQDIFYDPQTSGGLLIAVAQKDAAKLYGELSSSMDGVSIVGYMGRQEDHAIVIE